MRQERERLKTRFVTSGIVIVMVLILGMIGYFNAKSDSKKPKNHAYTEIYCPHCHTHLYNYKRIVFFDSENHQIVMKAEDFIPVVKGMPQPTEESPFECCYCHAPLNGWQYWFWKRHQNLPKFSTYIVSVMTKDEYGNFKWIPYDININDEGDEMLNTLKPPEGKNGTSNDDSEKTEGND